MNSVYHIPVLRDEAIFYLINPLIKKEVFVDGTLGGGGYTEAILQKISNSGRVICIDKDIHAIDFAKNKLEDSKEKLVFVKGNFANVNEILAELEIEFISGIVLDLGLSSFQLDEEEGFSFIKDTPLDMRADKDSKLTAEILLNEYEETELTKIFEDFGEVHNARRLSRAIVSKRKSERILTTWDFVKIVQREYGFKKDVPKKFFSKIFQALRIAVNDELSDLRRVLNDSAEIMCDGGRIVVVSYHSLEDRIVKEFFRNYKNEEREIKILTKKVIKPEYEEIRKNSKARSAKLRAAEVRIS